MVTAALEGSEDVSGSITLMGIWVGTEQQAIQGVLDSFAEAYPNVDVEYLPAGDEIVTRLSTALEGGNPPGLATVAQPGAIADFAQAGDITPLNFAVDAATENLGESVVETGSVDGTSTTSSSRRSTSRPSGTTSRRSRTPASRRRRPGTTCLPRGHPERLGHPGVLARRSRRVDAHRPVREHLHPHGGRRDVRPARKARDPVDRPVGEGCAHATGRDLRERRKPRRRRAAPCRPTTQARSQGAHRRS